MKLANTIKLSVFVKPDEEERTILDSLKSIIPFDMEKEKISIEKQIAIDSSNKKIIICDVWLKKTRHTRAFIEKINAQLSSRDKKRLLEEENRLDDDCCFFMRFDKESLVKNKKLVLTDKGNCFHITISICTHPKKKEVAMKLIKEIFK